MQRLLTERIGVVPYGWSAGGKFLLYGSYPTRDNMDLWTLPIASANKPIPVANSPFDEKNGQFSPDGRWIAFQSDETGRYEIYVVPFEGGSGKWQVSTNGGLAPRWRHDGNELSLLHLMDR